MKPIVAIQGASNVAIQALMAEFVRRWSGRGVKIVGVVEAREVASTGYAVLRDVATHLTYPLYQDLGPGSTACRLTGAGVTEACAALCRQIVSGCDLVVLSKFGKLEAGRSGLIDAFTAAVETETPVLTAVSPTFEAQWRSFAGPLAVYVPPHAPSLDHWWSDMRHSRPVRAVRRTG